MARGEGHSGLRKTYTVLRFVLGLASVALIFVGVVELFQSVQSASTRIRDIATESLQSESDHRVLFISSYSQTHFTVPEEWQGLEEGFAGKGVSFDTEYMDTKNHPDEASVERFAALLEGKLETTHYDAVIVGDDAALHFVDDHRADFFRDMPVVYIGINDIDYAQQVHEDGWATGVPEEGNFSDVFHSAARLFPDCTSFACIVDDTPTGAADLVQIQRIKGQFPQYDFNIIDTSVLSRDEYIDAIEALDDKAIVMELDSFEDGDGNVYTIDDTVRLIASHTDRPIFRASTGGVGNGVLGSGFLDFNEHARQAALMAVKIIHGTSPADIPLVHQTQTHYVFDGKLMDRYGIDKADLPPYSTVMNSSETYWEEYRDVLTPALHIFTGLIILILILVGSTVQSLRDAKSLRKSEAELRHRLYFDRLTDLGNRNSLLTSDNDKYRSAAAFNIDDFKFINERHGISCGDEVLKEVARRLKSIPDSKPIRLGGDEFLVLFEGGVGEDPELIGRLDRMLHEPYLYGNERIEVSIAAGFADRQEGESIDDLTTHAELALYYGRRGDVHHGFQIYEQGIKDKIDRRNALVNDLQAAIQEQSFTVLYQPQVDAGSKGLVGLEALCRFKDNKYYPDQFIPVAEESGYIIELDRIVTRKVVEQLASWRDVGYELPVVSINYSAHQLRDTGYAEYVGGLLRERGIPSDRIKIEITERSVFADQERSEEFFRAMHAMGIRVALDDFGTGYSSITSVSQLPVDDIKFDKSLIDNYLVEGRLTFLENLTALVHDMGKKVIAEGVETSDQYQLVKQIGIDQIQGYYFDKPLPANRAISVEYSSR